MTTASTVSPAVIGGAVGVVAGGLLAFVTTKTFFHKADIGVVVAGAAAGGLIGAALNTTPAVAATAALPVSPTSGPPTQTLVLAADQSAYQAIASVGQTVAITLPAGGSWASGGNNPQTGNAPFVWTVQAAGSVSVVWTDSTGASHTQAVSFNLPPI